jgi:dipeptidyl aminopeptidase/acylaminoacyl peptidase
MKKLHFLISLLFLHFSNMQAQENLTYQKPAEHLAKLFEAPQTPSITMNTQRTYMLLMERPGFPSIEEVAQPEMRLAGLRINPKNNGPSRSYSYNKITIKDLKTSIEYPIDGLPQNPRISNLSWSPDGSKFAFSNSTPNGIELWINDLVSKKAKKISIDMLNDVFRNTISWTPASDALIVRVVDTERGNEPTAPLAPSGPVIQSNTGGEAPVRTYQDLLKNKFDEQLFNFYSSGKIIRVDLAGKQTPITNKGIFPSVDISPDGKYILLTRILEPFSYIVPYNRFTQKYEIWTIDGKLLKVLAEIPAVEEMPKGFDAEREGPRYFSWRSDAPSTLYFVKALDGGDPKNEVEFRDEVFSWNAPFHDEPVSVTKLKLRFAGIEWGNNTFAIISEYFYKTRKEVSYAFNPSEPKELKLIFDLNSEDAYSNPGSFEMERNANGKLVLLMNKAQNKLYLNGMGASPKGNEPFIDEFDMSTFKSTRLWQSKAPFFEEAMLMVNLEKSQILVSRESQTQNPNYFLVDYKKRKDLAQITNFGHPYPSLANVKSEYIQYERKDGVKLSGKLYLPAGYDKAKDGPLPVLMWAYPQEFKSASAAGQITDSPYRFIRMSAHSPLYWVADGYAVLDDPSFPIIGEGEEEPNDKFIEQLVGSAEAAINKLVEMGVGDKNRVAVGGHSYGAFMTANLLSHSNLFAAGIARSGAYNRTLTPFGFQSEERTLWEAKNVYTEMSPFMHAEKLNAPILLIHGEADNNSGTFPMQSERYFAALKGNGKTVRLVMLPHESHGYSSYESIMHMAWEMTEWLNKYVKNKK